MLPVIFGKLRSSCVYSPDALLSSTVAASCQFIDWPLVSAVVAVESDDRCCSRDGFVILTTEHRVFKFQRFHVCEFTIGTYAVVADHASTV